MKHLCLRIALSLIPYTLSLSPAISQVKILRATQQKTLGGRGGVFMNYSIDLVPKKGEKLELDSVRTIAGRIKINTGWMPTDSGYYQVSFGFALQAAPKCPTCEDIAPNPPNMTKGVKVYYRKNGKRATMKVKKFKELEEFRAP